MRWPSLWQRLFLVALIILNAWEAYVLFPHRPSLALLNVAIGFLLLLALGSTWAGKRRDR